MINLKKLYGEKYQVRFDKEIYDLNKEMMEEGPSKIKFSKADFYSIICKYGKIYYYGENMLTLVCNSRRISNKINIEMTDKIDYSLTCDEDALFHFNHKYIQEIFEYVKPLRKRHKTLTEKGKKKLFDGLKKYKEKQNE